MRAILFLVKSRRGSVKAKVRFNEALMKSIVFMSFHFAPVNRLTSPVRDLLSRMPALKVSWVDLIPQ